MLLLRVGSILKPIRIVLYATLVFVIASCIGPWIALLFICHFEKDYQLSKTVYNGIRCLDREPNGVLILFLVSANLLTDLLIFPIPSYLMRGLRGVSLKARLTLIATFALSLG